MTEVKHKSAVRRFLEQLSVPLTVATVLGLGVWALWVTLGTLGTENVDLRFQDHDVRIDSNSMRINSQNSDARVLRSELDGAKEDISDIRVEIRSGFERQESLIREALFGNQ